MLGGACNFEKRSKNPNSEPMSKSEVREAFYALQPSEMEQKEFKTLVGAVKSLDNEHFKNLSSVSNNRQKKLAYKEAVLQTVKAYKFTVENPNSVKHHVLSYAAFCDTLTYAKAGFHRNGGSVQRDLLTEAKTYAPAAKGKSLEVEMETRLTPLKS